MLSRTAENLFWLARYMERAETMARLLEVGYRMGLMPSAGTGYRNEWASLVAAAGSSAGFEAKYGEEFRQRDVESWLFYDRDNGSSVISCLEAARQNGRAVRTALTTSMWDALNVAYLELKEIERRPRSASPLPELCDWTKRQSALLRGTTETTHLQNDGYDFLNIGSYLERGDNTARLLDVKYYVLLPTTDMVGGGVDTYQWTTLLRALSAFRSFHWTYGSEYSPRKIAHFLILNKACPRSLLHCQDKIGFHLERLARGYGHSVKAHARQRGEQKLAVAGIGGDIGLQLVAAVHRHQPGMLAERGRGEEQVSPPGLCCGHRAFGNDHPAQAPGRHAEVFGKAVDHQCLGQLLKHRGGVQAIADPVIDLVRNDGDPAFAADLGDGAQLLARDDRAGRVVGRRPQDDPIPAAGRADPRFLVHERGQAQVGSDRC